MQSHAFAITHDGPVRVKRLSMWFSQDTKQFDAILHPAHPYIILDTLKKRVAVRLFLLLVLHM